MNKKASCKKLTIPIQTCASHFTELASDNLSDIIFHSSVKITAKKKNFQKLIIEEFVISPKQAVATKTWKQPPKTKTICIKSNSPQWSI